MADPFEQIADSYSAQRNAGPSKKHKEVTVADFQKVLDSTPLFMSQTPESVDNEEGNYVMEALRSLVFEGEGDEVAQNLKDHGNELHAQKSYSEAVKAYTDGLDAKPTTPLRITLLNNRAACNLALKNYRATLRDAGSVIAICTQEKMDVPKKALFRAAQALTALERWTEAKDVVQRGLEGNEGDKAWIELEGRVDVGLKRVKERKERERREVLSKRALKEAIDARGLITVTTPSPPDNPNPAHFDPSAVPSLPLSDTTWSAPPITTPLIYPVFLLYPAYSQSDLITHFSETTSLGDQLSVMFPLSPSDLGQSGWAPWDEKREYYTQNLVVYVETRGQRLLKCGKDLPLTEVLAKAVKLDNGKVVDGVALKDGLMSFIVLPKGGVEKKWIEEYKKSRDGL